MIDALRWLLPMLTAWHVSGHPDAAALAAAANEFQVPPTVMWAVAYEETRHSTRNTEVSRTGALGRMQIMPSFWRARCGALYGRRHYLNNIRCGALVLRAYLNICDESVECAAWHYVGGDSSYARRVREHAWLYEAQR